MINTDCTGSCKFNLPVYKYLAKYHLQFVKASKQLLFYYLLSSGRKVTSEFDLTDDRVNGILTTTNLVKLGVRSSATGSCHIFSHFKFIMKDPV